MRLSSTEKRYGLVFVVLHWTMAAVVFFLFALGLWMRSLSYTHSWYNFAPHIHESFGLLLFAMLLFRTAWTTLAAKPEPAPMPAWEAAAAWAVQKLLYLLLFCVTISGYLIAAADGKPIAFFNITTVPALVIPGIEHQADKAGDFHYYLAISLVCLAGLHAAAALKHHFIDRDRTLLSMLGIEDKRK